MAQARNVLVTGGNRGIGLSIARAFVEDGDNVLITYRTGEPPEGLRGVRCDITDSASVDAAFGEAEEIFGGPIEVLVANAGMTADQLLLRMSDDDFTSVVDTNLTGAYRCVRRVIKGMIRLKRGRIVLIGSVVGLMGAPGQVNYAASKAGLTGMARALTRELGSRGITTNVVAPGYIETDMTAGLSDDRRGEYMMLIPAKRFGDPDEVAQAVRFVASEQAGYISGAVIPVDGGVSMGH